MENESRYKIMSGLRYKFITAKIMEKVEAGEKVEESQELKKQHERKEKCFYVSKKTTVL